MYYIVLYVWPTVCIREEVLPQTIKTNPTCCISVLCLNPPWNWKILFLILPYIFIFVLLSFPIKLPATTRSRSRSPAFIIDSSFPLASKPELWKETYLLRLRRASLYNVSKIHNRKRINFSCPTQIVRRDVWCMIAFFWSYRSVSSVNFRCVEWDLAHVPSLVRVNKSQRICSAADSWAPAAQSKGNATKGLSEKFLVYFELWF